jgi:hypothetical protein
MHTGVRRCASVRVRRAQRARQQAHNIHAQSLHGFVAPLLNSGGWRGERREWGRERGVEGREKVVGEIEENERDTGRMRGHRENEREKEEMKGKQRG